MDLVWCLMGLRCLSGPKVVPSGPKVVLNGPKVMPNGPRVPKWA